MDNHYAYIVSKLAEMQAKSLSDKLEELATECDTLSVCLEHLNIELKKILEEKEKKPCPKKKKKYKKKCGNSE